MKKNLSQEEIKRLTEQKVSQLLKNPKKLKSVDNQTQKEKKWAANFGEDPNAPGTPPPTKKVMEEVPVKIDSRTTIYVRKDKCYQLPDGSWAKKPKDEK